MSDLIERQEALDAIYACHVWGDELKRGTYDVRESDHCTETLLDAISAVEDVPSARQWILCSERLPEKLGEYLVCTDEQYIYLTVWFNDERKWAVIWEYENINVVAWMPLPEPLEEVET